MSANLAYLTSASVIPSGLSFPEQIITAFYNPKFWNECFSQHFERVIQDGAKSFFRSYEELDRADDIDFWPPHHVLKRCAEVCEPMANKIMNYEEYFGWKNPKESFVSLMEDLEPYYEGYQRRGFEETLPITKRIFNEFIQSYPQYGSRITEFRAILFHIKMFMDADFIEIKFQFDVSAYPEFMKYSQVNITEHFDLLEDMTAYFTPRSRAKSAQSYIDVNTFKPTNERYNSHIH